MCQVEDGIRYELLRHAGSDGLDTTVYVVRHPRERTRIGVLHLDPPERLDEWCAANGHPEAIVGGFFLRDPYRPLGALWRDGEEIPHEAVPAPYAARRACVASDGDGIVLRALGDAPAAGDLLQAGPMLVAGGSVAFDRETDHEGFSAGSGQFDSDITDGPHPRAALGLSADEVIAVVCDGRRTGVDSGLTMPDLAALLLGLGAQDAINLDGGGSTTLVHRGHLMNRPYSNQDQPAPASRPVVSALVLDPA
jgi:exopolysaccharide biosynthesis protein